MTSTDAAKPIIYYKDSDYLVSNAKVKSPRKTYRVDKIEKISLRRDPFYFSLAFTILLAFFVMKFGSSVGEGVFRFLLVCIVFTSILRRFGMIMLTSKAISELAFIGLYGRLADVREAIERAMHKEDKDDGLAAHDAADDDDE